VTCPGKYDRPEVEYVGVDGPRPGKGAIDEAFKVFGGADRLRAPPGQGGTPAGDVCRQLGISEATFYQWKKKFAHLGSASSDRCDNWRMRIGG
jgi:hypothetical protein